MAAAPDADAVSRIIMLTYGAMEQGGQYWCYVAVKPSRYEEFSRKMDSRQYNMQHFADDGYGEVIVSGEGVVPPKEITHQVAKMFNIPLKSFFKDTDPAKTIAMKIQQINTEQPPL